MSPRVGWARALSWAALAGLLLGLSGCDGEVSAGTDFDGDKLPATAQLEPLTQLLAQSVEAPWQTRYAGVRRVESQVVNGNNQVGLAYREEVAADGTGRFALDTVEVLSFVPDPVVFGLTQKLREGFLYRYRDFRIRDLSLFFSNYLVQDLGETTVADRPCAQIQVRRKAEVASAFLVALDQATGLVLKFEERDANGQLRTAMEFESLDLDPDLEGVAWFELDTPEKSLDLGQDLGAQVGFEVMQPAVYPEEFQLWKATSLRADDDTRWVKLTLTDGLEPLFFFQKVQAPVVLEGSGVTAAPTSTQLDEVWVYQMGAVQVVQGTVRDHEILALGKVPAELLLDLIESAVD